MTEQLEEDTTSSIIDRERIFFVLQRRRATGQWVTVGVAIMGMSAANRDLEKKAKESPNEKFRVLARSHANYYRQGWKDHEAFAKNGIHI